MSERRVAVCGGGIFRPDIWRGECGEEGVAIAYKDMIGSMPGFDPADVDAVIMSYFSDHLNQQLCMGWIIQDYLGLHNKPGYRVEAGGSTGLDAIANAYYMIKSGLFDVILVPGWEWMNEVDTATTNMMIASAADTDWDFTVGGYYNAYYASLEVRHMQLYGETCEDLGKIAVKNHNAATHNPFAQWRMEHGTSYITLDDYWKSKLVCWPYRTLNNALMSEGAACLLLAAEDKVKRYTDNPMWISGVGLGSDSMRPGDRLVDFPFASFRDQAAIYPEFIKKPRTPYPEMANFGSLHVAALRAYAQAGITDPLKEIDIAELFTPYDGVELCLYEDLGFCGRGQGKEVVRDGLCEYGGELPVTMSGGLTAQGHPVGATSLYQTIFLYYQLAGKARKKYGKDALQVKNAKKAIITGHGGTACQGGVIVLERD